VPPLSIHPILSRQLQPSKVGKLGDGSFVGATRSAKQSAGEQGGGGRLFSSPTQQ